MPDETQELRRINWNECFGFIRIFRSFRMAIHPSKLVLATAGLILTGAVGLIMDSIWCASGHSVLPGEIAAYLQSDDVAQWRHAQMRSGRQIVQEILADDNVLDREKDPAGAVATDDAYLATLDRLPRRIREHYEKTIEEIDRADKDGLTKRIRELAPSGGGATQDMRDDPSQLRSLARQLALEAHQTALQKVQTLQPRGIFRSFLQCQRGCLRQAVESAWGLNFVGMMGDVMGDRRAAVQVFQAPMADGPGLIPTLMMMALVKKWLFTQHWFFAVIFGLLALAIWSFVGGAICRIAALHATRDERIPMKQALGFARRKFVGFFAAPLIPVALIVFIGVFLAIGGLVMAIPYVGEVVGGFLFFLALLGGFVMALVLIGAVAGGSLMWPTIAVEGSDSFDAISRSFSYIYSKPWRTLLYFLVASVYGAICFLFVRFFVFLMLLLTRGFVGIGLWGTSREAAGAGMTKMDTMWKMPSFEALMPCWASLGREGADAWGGFLIAIWVGLAVVLSYAFLICLYYSASTVAYTLLRREVDATDLEEVYVEETEEETPPATPSPAPAPAPSPAPAPTSTAPPVEPPPASPAPEPPGSPTGESPTTGN